MNTKRLLIPFTHGLHMLALEYAVELAKSYNATLVAASFLYAGKGRNRSPRLDYLEQSNDFLEAILNKATQAGVPVERAEIVTEDVIQSINTVVQEMNCDGIVLFARGNHSLLLQPAEVQRLLEEARCKLWIARLESGKHEKIAQALWQRVRRVFSTPLQSSSHPLKSAK